MDNEVFSHEASTLEEKESNWSLANKIFGITAVYFGNAFVGTAVFATILPTQVFDIVGEEKKEITLSLVGLLGSIGSIIATPIFGALSDKTNFKFGKRRSYILVGVPAASVCYMALSFFTSTHWINVAALVILLLLCQIAVAVVLGPYGGLLPDLIPKESQGIASGVQALGLSLGTLAGAFFAGIALEYSPTSIKYFVAYGISCAGFCIPSLYTIFGIREKYVEDVEQEEEEEPQVSLKIRIFQQLLKTFHFPCDVYYTFYLVSFCTFVIFLGFNMLGPYIQYFCRDVLLIDKPVLAASLAIMTFVLATAFGSVIGGFLCDKLGPRLIAFISISTILAGYASYMVVLLFIYNTIVAGIIFFACYLVLGFGFGGALASTNVLTLNCIPKETMARDFSIVHQFISLGQIFGMLIGGQILGWIKVVSIRLAYLTLVLFTCFCFIMALVVLFFIKVDIVGTWREKKTEKYSDLDDAFEHEQTVEDI